MQHNRSALEFEDPEQAKHTHETMLHKLMHQHKYSFDLRDNHLNNSRMMVFKDRVKKHTIRQGKRFDVGDKVHLVVGNRSKHRRQFFPTLKCPLVELISIYPKDREVVVDGVILSIEVLEMLAIQDGFESVEDFWRYFNEDFHGQIIHWMENERYSLIELKSPEHRLIQFNKFKLKLCVESKQPLFPTN
jgi:hypothetical protein